MQVNDGLIALRVEKVARRRLDERNEKLRSARAARFDLRTNPFFSRPLHSSKKGVTRLEQEQPSTEEQTEDVSPPHAARVGCTNRLRVIFPAADGTRYHPLFVLDKVADIYMQWAVGPGHQTMTGRQFRSFAK